MKKIYLILSLAALMCCYTSTASAMDSLSPTEVITATEVELKVNGHMVDIINIGQEPVHVIVYALTGQIVNQIEAHPGTTTLELSPGYYIVKADKLSRRIVIR